jgi:hypothetical protein
MEYAWRVALKQVNECKLKFGVIDEFVKSERCLTVTEVSDDLIRYATTCKNRPVTAPTPDDLKNV